MSALHKPVVWGTWATFGVSLGVTGPSAAAAMTATAAIRDAGYGAFVEVVSSDGKSVAIALGEDQRTALANANKIAAAPELLKCLEWVLKTHSMCAHESNEIRAVIAKATGSAA